jgi:tetratricopeptide (TPR) repeat protein
VRLLAELLDSSSESYVWTPVCNALRMIGTVEARRALTRARGSDEEHLRNIAARNFEQLTDNSPAFGFAAQAEQAIRDDDLERANEFLAVAVQVDPDYGGAYSKRGHLRLKQSRNEEARADFAKAVELNEYDDIAVTGLLIVDAMSGKYVEAVEALQAAAPRFPKNALFEYNSACVYGRALEQVARADPSAERDARVGEYQVEALAHLKRSLELGFADHDWIGKDPDLSALSDVPEFQELLQNLPETETEREGQAGQLRLVPGGAQFQFRLR